MQKAKKQKVSDEEIQLKNIGSQKFNIAQSLDGGRDYLNAIVDTASSARDLEKLNTQNAIQLASEDLMQNAGVGYNDTRLGGRAGIVAEAQKQEDVLGVRDALLQADLGNSSAVSSSTRAAAESKFRLNNILANNEMARRADNINIIGSVAGFAAPHVSDYFKSSHPGIKNGTLKKSKTINSADDLDLSAFGYG